MMVQKLRFGLSVVCGALVCLLFVWSIGQMLFPAKTSAAPTGQTVSAVTESPQYLLKAYQGKVALFLPPAETPDTVYPIHLNMLPTLDQRRLTRGIYLTDKQTVDRYIADFES